MPSPQNGCGTLVKSQAACIWGGGMPLSKPFLPSLTAQLDAPLLRPLRPPALALCPGAQLISNPRRHTHTHTPTWSICLTRPAAWLSPVLTRPLTRPAAWLSPGLTRPAAWLSPTSPPSQTFAMAGGLRRSDLSAAAAAAANPTATTCAQRETCVHLHHCRLLLPAASATASAASAQSSSSSLSL